jgi:hypothetical protein
MIFQDYRAVFSAATGVNLALILIYAHPAKVRTDKEIHPTVPVNKLFSMMEILLIVKVVFIFVKSA